MLSLFFFTVLGFKMKNYIRFLTLFLLTGLLLSACGSVDKLKDIRKPVDLRKDPLDPDARAQKNISEGKGISLKNLGGSRSTTYQFSTSNPMWRATLETLDFIPLTTVDYSGGMIITDWYSDDPNNNDSIKISIRFLSNEVAANNVKISVFKKNCDKLNNCTTKLSKSKIESELLKTILTRASILNKAKK